VVFSSAVTDIPNGANGRTSVTAVKALDERVQQRLIQITLVEQSRDALQPFARPRRLLEIHRDQNTRAE
jgi:hypothetical protein